MFLGGWLEKKVGPRFSTLIGGGLMSSGVILSYFTIKVSFWLLLLTYGLVFGLGVGIAYVGPLSSAMRWMPRWKGVAGGCVVAGFGLGALFFDQVQSYYINPDNLKPESNDYFTDKELLDRVPFMFLILGGTYAVMQFVGSMLIVNPSHVSENNSRPVRNKRKERYDSTEEKRKDVNVHRDNISRCRDDSITPSTCDLGSESDVISDSEDDSLLIKQEDSHSSSRSDAGINSSPEKPLSAEESLTNNHKEGIHPLMVLRSFNFYHLWVMFLLAGFSVTFIANLYKVFGLSFIDDDQFLAIVGSASSILNCTGRIVWGLVADRFTFKIAFVLQSAIMTIFMLTFYITSVVGKSMFFLWVCVIFFCVGGNFSVFPTAIALSFGPKYIGINYGLLFTSQISSGVIAAVLFTTLQTLLGWDGMIFLVSGISLAGFLVSMAFRSRQSAY